MGKERRRKTGSSLVKIFLAFLLMLTITYTT
jgi:hypothetical protein